MSYHNGMPWSSLACFYMPPDLLASLPSHSCYCVSHFSTCATSAFFPSVAAAHGIRVDTDTGVSRGTSHWELVVEGPGPLVVNSSSVLLGLVQTEAAGPRKETGAQRLVATDR